MVKGHRGLDFGGRCWQPEDLLVEVSHAYAISEGLLVTHGLLPFDFRQAEGPRPLVAVRRGGYLRILLHPQDENGSRFEWLGRFDIRPVARKISHYALHFAKNSAAGIRLTNNMGLRMISQSGSPGLFPLRCGFHFPSISQGIGRAGQPDLMSIFLVSED
jgi:hypothetical protein